MDYRCDIVVLTWNQKDVIKSFVESFLENTQINCRLIIVANGCTDGTPEYLAALKDTPNCSFKILVNRENNGFVGAMNQGIELADAPYVCLANNDLLFTPGWLEEIISVFESNAKIGLLNPNSNNLGLRPAQGESLQSVAAKLKQEKSGFFIEMPFCIGFCMFIRREVIAKIGGLSREFYPAFFEDTDYSLRAANAGFLIGTAAGAYVWHKEHGHFNRTGKEEREALFAKSRETFTRKWGKTLRIAWVANNYQEAFDNLSAGIELARQANFITFYVRDTDISRRDIFKAKAAFEHSGVQFKSFHSYVGLIWNIVIKKKKFDLVICKDSPLSRILKALGSRTAVYPDNALLSALRKS